MLAEKLRFPMTLRKWFFQNSAVSIARIDVGGEALFSEASMPYI
jgi:hypothetical protein